VITAGANKVAPSAFPYNARSPARMAPTSLASDKQLWPGVRRPRRAEVEIGSGQPRLNDPLPDDHRATTRWHACSEVGRTLNSVSGILGKRLRVAVVAVYGCLVLRACRSGATTPSDDLAGIWTVESDDVPGALDPPAGTAHVTNVAHELHGPNSQTMEAGLARDTATAADDPRTPLTSPANARRGARLLNGRRSLG
jgi:hypothetical protein